MNKTILKLLISLSIIVCFGLHIDAQSIDSEGIFPNKKEFHIECAADVAFTNCNTKTFVDVKTKITSLKRPLDFQYTVSGGQISGHGASIQWNMSSLPPGEYEITVIVKDKNKNQKTLTETIKIIAVPVLCGLCACPTISVSSLSQITAGEDLTFTTNVSGGSEDYTYNWTLSSGEIIAGQGTASIKISTKGLSDNFITATVKLSGVCPTCPTTASETVKIIH